MERAKVIFAYTSEREDELSIQVYCLTPSPPPHPHTSHPHTSHTHTLTRTPHTAAPYTLTPHPHIPTPSHHHASHPHTLTPLHPHASHCHTLTPHILTPPHPQPGALTSLLLHSYSFHSFTHRTPHLSYFTLTPHVPGW